jgi:hypothetical protein
MGYNFTVFGKLDFIMDYSLDFKQICQTVYALILDHRRRDRQM